MRIAIRPPVSSASSWRGRASKSAAPTAAGPGSRPRPPPPPGQVPGQPLGRRRGAPTLGRRKNDPRPSPPRPMEKIGTSDRRAASRSSAKDAWLMVSMPS